MSIWRVFLGDWRCKYDDEKRSQYYFETEEAAEAFYDSYVKYHQEEHEEEYQTQLRKWRDQLRRDTKRAQELLDQGKKIRYTSQPEPPTRKPFKPFPTFPEVSTEIEFTTGKWND